LYLRHFIIDTTLAACRSINKLAARPSDSDKYKRASFTGAPFLFCLEHNV
jgi:hypothetical protein